MDPSNHLRPLSVKSPSTVPYSKRRLIQSSSLKRSLSMDDLSPDDVGSIWRSLLQSPSNQPSEVYSGSSTAAASLPKVCIATAGIVEHKIGHHFYIVDLNSNTQHCCQRVGEIIDDSSAICVVGFNVYKFEAEDVHKFDENQKRVYRYKLSPNSVGVKRLDDENQKCLCKMKDPKFCPDAVPAPDGSRILVYSSTIRSNQRCDFELFDVKKETCEDLPKLPLWGEWERKTKTASVRSAFFRSASALLVLLETRVYSLKIDRKIDRKSWKWERKFDFLNNWVPMGTPFEMVGDKTYLTPIKAYDDRLPGCTFTYPDLSSHQKEFSGPLYPMLLNSSVSDQVDFCILHAGAEPVKGSRSKPNYIIDVYRCDLKEKESKIKIKMEEEQKRKDEQKREMKMKEKQKRKTKKQKREEQKGEEEEQRKTKKQKREEEKLPGTTKINILKFCLEEDDSFLLRHCRFTPINS